MFPGKRTERALWAALAALVLGFAAVVVSPYWVASRLTDAVLARDAATVLGYLDLPAIRASARRTARSRDAGALADGLVDLVYNDATVSRFLAAPPDDFLAAVEGATWRYVDAQDFTITLRYGDGEAVTVALRRDPWPWRVVGLRGEPR